MAQRFLNIRFKIAGHIVFWVASIVLLTLIFSFYSTKFTFALVEKALIINLGFAVAVYVNLQVLIPRFLKQKNYIFYIFWLTVLLTFSSVLIQLLFFFPFGKLFPEAPGRLPGFDTSLHSAYFFSTLVYVAVTSFLKFIKEWIELQDLNLKLARTEQQKLEAELNTLKGQLNPHFLFNSLNNIYSLALIQSEKVPELILRLSDLMRHIIYESREKFIPLEKEIEFVTNFISLQKIRSSEQTKIDFRIVGDIPDARIAPLLFEPFIDNAFKHGLPGNGNSDFISIVFDFTENDRLFFQIENNFEEAEAGLKKHSGIGIENVKKRLALLYQADDYRLDITKRDNIHKVILQLKLRNDGN